jgi:hypothetical protein
MNPISIPDAKNPMPSKVTMLTTSEGVGYNAPTAKKKIPIPNSRKGTELGLRKILSITLMP